MFPIVDNPFDKTNPDIGVWGVLGEKGLLILGGIWGGWITGVRRMARDWHCQVW